MSREETIKRYNEILDRITENIKEAEDFKDDLYDRYKPEDGDIQEIVTIQSMIMKINDVISMKNQNKVEIERQLLDFEQETAEVQV